MNKVIRKLAEQSGFFPVPDETETDWEYRAENARYENFAELIVRECMDVAKYHTPDTEDCDYTWLIHNKIGKHFGVLE